jgi:hypothetical protein
VSRTRAGVSDLLVLAGVSDLLVLAGVPLGRSSLPAVHRIWFIRHQARAKISNHKQSR